MTNAPAGWYPDTEQPENERWWDGNQWTEHRRPSGPPIATEPTSPAERQAQPIESSLDSTIPLSAGPYAPPAFSGTAQMAPVKPLWKRTWFIVVAALVALIVVGSVSGAIASVKNSDNTSAVANTSSIATPAPTASSVAPSPTPTLASAPPAVAAVDPTYFKANANKQLDDYAKDLGDLSDAVAKGSTLRVMSNSVELAFNQGELAAVAPTANISVEWSAAFAGLSITTSQIADAISKEDYTTVNALVGQAAQQVASLRDIAGRAA